MQPCNRIRPSRIAAKRANEVLCVMNYQDLEIAEWLNSEEVEDSDNQMLNTKNNIPDNLPIIEDIELWSKNPWIKEEEK